MDPLFPAGGPHAIAAEDEPGRRDLLRLAAEQVAEMRPATANGLPAQDRLPRGGGTAYALAVLDGDGQPAEVVVAFPSPGAADLYARHKDHMTDWRVVPVRFLASGPRART